MKKKFFVPLCLLVAMASCNKSVLEETIVVPGANEIATNASISYGGETVFTPDQYTWSVIWGDQFTDANLTGWTKANETHYPGTATDPAIDIWFKDPNMVSVNTSTGILSLASKKVYNSTQNRYELRCGTIVGTKDFTNYGFYTAKMYIQSPYSLSSQSSFWLNYRNDGTDATGGNDGAEIDVFESSWTNENMQSTVHIDWYNGQHASHGIGNQWQAPGATTGYHQYGVWWQSASLSIWFDGVKKASLTATYYIPKAGAKEFIKLGTAAAWGNANTNFGSQPNGTTRYTYVDWVRYMTHN